MTQTLMEAEMRQDQRARAEGFVQGAAQARKDQRKDIGNA